jgi:DUF1009 family protein
MSSDPHGQTFEAERRPIAIFAGGGVLPRIVTAAALRAGLRPIIFAIAGEADPNDFPGVAVHEVRFPDVGKVWRLMAESACREALFIGSVGRRPSATGLDAEIQVPFMPQLAQLLRGGDDRLLSGIARIFEENGVALISVLDLLPEIALREGAVTRTQPTDSDWVDIGKGAEAAKVLGSLDIGQAAISIEGRVVAVEGAEGTDGMIERLQPMRENGRIPASGGVLVKRVKPQQDRRFDLPTVGPETARRAREAQLSGVACEAHATLLAGRDETIAAFDREGLFLVGVSEDQERRR